jgi:hypothetical protein
MWMWASKTDFHRFYDSEGNSDVVVMLPSRPGDPVRRIRAHKVILAAASGHFKKTLLENAYIVSNDALSYGSSVFTNQTQEEKKPALVIPREDVKMMTPAIQFIYGFGLPGAYKTLHDVAEIVAIAEKYEIADLLTRATEIANNLLGGCLGDEAKLKGFLAFNRVQHFSLTSGLMHNFAVGFIKQNLKRLQGTGAFQDLVESEPKLTVMLLNAVVFEME